MLSFLGGVLFKQSETYLSPVFSLFSVAFSDSGRMQVSTLTVVTLLCAQANYSCTIVIRSEHSTHPNPV